MCVPVSIKVLSAHLQINRLRDELSNCKVFITYRYIPDKMAKCQECAC